MTTNITSERHNIVYKINIQTFYKTKTKRREASRVENNVQIPQIIYIGQLCIAKIDKNGNI